jgi:hypothetical protein
MESARKELPFNPPGQPARFVAVGALSCLALVISYFVGRAAGLSPDDPQYFGMAVSVAFAFTCAIIVVQNRRLRRMRGALAAITANREAPRNDDDIVIAANEAPLVPTFESRADKPVITRLRLTP